MLARLFVIVGGLIVLVLTLALVAPYFIDWTSYRAQFEREASTILGRRVTVEGSATARLLPFPSVTFSDVTVAGVRPGEPGMTVETFSMDAELAPFMRGELLIFDMRLVRPHAVIRVAENGVVDWAVRPTAPFDPAQIALENVTVTDGEVTILHGSSGRTHRLRGIDATVSARALIGPWRMNGTLALDDVPAAFSISTGKVDDTGAMRLRLSVEPDRYPVAIETDGNVLLEQGALRYRGSFRMGVGVQSADNAGKDGEAAPAEPKGRAPYRITGTYELDHRALDLSEFRFETGAAENPYTAEGSAHLDFGTEPRFTLEMNGARMHFDESVAGAEPGSGLTLSGRLAALERALANMPRPSIPGTVSVNLPAVLVGDTTVREVKLSAEPAEVGWRVNSFAATLPGRATLEGKGVLRNAPELGFTGSMLLAVGQPSGFAAWLSREVDDSIRRLPAAGFSADIDITRREQHFRNAELIMGHARFRGSLENLQLDNARPATRLDLQGSALDVESLSAFASLFVSDKSGNRFPDRDLDLTVKAGPVSVAGLTAETVDTALRLREGTLEVDRLLIGGLEGAQISATGTLRDFPAAPSGDIDASIIAGDLAPVVQRLADRYTQHSVLRELRRRVAAYPGLLEDARIDMLLSAVANAGKPTGYAVTANGEAGGSTLSLTASFSGEPDALDEATVSAALSARNPSAERLLALYGLPVLPLGLLGPAETELRLKGSPADGLATTLSFSGEGASLNADGTLIDGENGPALTGNVRLQAQDIEPWLMTTGFGLPGMGYGRSADLSATMRYADGTLSATEMTGNIEGNAVQGALRATGASGTPHLEGELKVDRLDLPLLASLVLGQPSLQADGRWPRTPFQNRVTAPVFADLRLTAAEVDAGAFGKATGISTVLSLDAEGLRLDRLSGRTLDGQLIGRLELKNTEGTGLLSSQIRLTDIDLHELMPGTGLTGRADLAASLSTSGKSVEGMVSALAGSGTLDARHLAIPHLDPAAFPAVMAEADRIGRDINPARVADFAPGLVKGGDFPVAAMQTTFTIAGGVLRTPPVSLDAPGARMTAELRADLPEASFVAQGAVTYRAGEEAVAGSDPTVRFHAEGPIARMETSLDIEPLAQFLTQRALEREQARVEAMQAALLEKQRLRREARYYASLQQERERAAEELRQAQEQARQRAEAEARARAEAEARARAEAERARQAELEQERQRAAQRELEKRAAEAIRKSEEERARSEAERNRPAEVEPAPAAPDPSLSVDDFLKSLQGG